DQPEHSAVARHSALPDAGHRERIAQHFRMIEQDVAEPAAQHDPEERPPGDEVTHLLNAKLGIAASHKNTQQPKTAGERQDVSHPVPARSEISPKVKDERIEIVQVI